MHAATEQKILDRLRAGLDASIAVAPIRELDAVADLRQKAPAVFVIYDGFRPSQVVANVPAMVQLTHDWFVVVCTRSARGNGAGNDARDKASEITSQVMNLLHGFPLGGAQFLQVQDSPGTDYDGGFCHVTLSFSNTATFKGQQ